MSRVKVLMLGLLVVLTVGAVSSASASASMFEWQELSGSTWQNISSEKAVLSEGDGNQILTVPAAGAEIICGLLHDNGVIRAGGLDEILSLVYSMCAVAKPASCGYVSSPGQPNGSIAVAPGLPSLLMLTSGGLLVDEIEENVTAKEFVTLLIRKEPAESSAKCGLIPKTSTVTGNDIAMVNNAAQSLESLGEGSLMALGALPAKYTGVDLQHLAGGGAFLGVEL